VRIFLILSISLAVLNLYGADIQVGGKTYPIPAISKSELNNLAGSTHRADKKNAAFYETFLAPLAKQVNSSNLSTRQKLSLYGFLVVETHRRNGIGYVWGGDMFDYDPDPQSRGGVGYDCSGYILSVYHVVLLESQFTDPDFRINAKDYLTLGREVLPLQKVDASFGKKVLTTADEGDVLIEPRGHIAMFARHPVTHEPIILQNGYEWDPLEKWIRENKGRQFCARSAFDEHGKLIASTSPLFRGKVMATQSMKTPHGQITIPVIPAYVRREMQRAEIWHADLGERFFQNYLSCIVAQVSETSSASTSQKVEFCMQIFEKYLSDWNLPFRSDGEMKERIRKGINCRTAHS